MLERFTDETRRVLVLSQEEARTLCHNHIGTEHILLGVIHEGESAAATALESLGVVRAQVTEIVGGASAPVLGGGSCAVHARAKKVLELSLREALQLGSDHRLHAPPPGTAPRGRWRRCAGAQPSRRGA